MAITKEIVQDKIEMYLIKRQCELVNAEPMRLLRVITF